MDDSDCTGMSHETVRVKEESDWLNDAETWAVSEAAARAGLYAGHEIKCELVLGPEVLHQPDVRHTTNETSHTDSDHSHRDSRHCDHTYAKRECPPVEVHVKVEHLTEDRECEAPGRGGEQLVRDCVVRLEHCPTLEPRGSGLLTRTTHDWEGFSAVNNTAEEAYACDMCGQTFALKSHLTEHLVLHIYTPAGSEPEGGCAADSSDSAGALSARALACGQQPPAPPPQRRAHHTHTPDTEHISERNNTFVCQICNEKFLDPRQLKSHMNIHMDTKPYSCEICSKQFQLLKCLTEHRLIHTEVKPYSSDSCSKQCNLKTHAMIHSGEKLYSCEICLKQFTQAEHVQTHMLTHKKTNTYSCEVCRKYFSRSYLITHRRIHTGEKPYSCGLCSKQFSHSTTLKRHILSHKNTKPYSCEVCKKQFTRSNNLKIHKRIHTGEKPYACELCSKQFSHSTPLKRHVLTHTRRKRKPVHIIKVFEIRQTTTHGQTVHM